MTEPRRCPVCGGVLPTSGRLTHEQLFTPEQMRAHYDHDRRKEKTKT